MNNNEKFLTIFTPTYNRGYILSKLYESLRCQSCDEFIWLIVDDGSSDNTRQLVHNWIAANEITIQYLFQENQGKAIAHNQGVKYTQTELFVCVDSDDYLVEHAVEKIKKCWKLMMDKDVVGILALRNVTRVLSKKAKNGTCMTLRNAYAQYGILGDTMLIFRTDIISKYQFPQFENEYFVPEAYLYDLIDQEGTLLLLKDVLYIGDYLEDGYTKNISKILKKNPNGYLAYINQRLNFDKKFTNRFLDTIRYIAFACVKKDGIIQNAVYPFIAIIAYPFGKILYWTRYKKL